MPDIAMCQNKECPSANRCHRFLAIPDEFWQAYIQFTPEDGEEGCIYYIEHYRASKNNKAHNING